MNKLRVNDTFRMGVIDCRIVGFAHHCGTPHYRFTWFLVSSPDKVIKQCGEMPVHFVDTMTGFNPSLLVLSTHEITSIPSA